jgi:hypothetical protein
MGLDGSLGPLSHVCQRQIEPGIYKILKVRTERGN